jgi:TRAP-type transport system periplasmic protein
MKKIKYASLFLLTGLMLAACGNSEATDSNTDGDSNTSGGDNKKTYTLTVNNFEPAGANIDVNVYQVWEKLVEEKTEGQVDVDIQNGGVLGPPVSMHTDLEAGLFDVGLVIANYAYDTKFFPYTVATLPFSAENSKQAAELLTEFTDKVVNKDEIQLQVSDAFTSDGYDLVSNKPIDVTDFKGLKMRASTAAESKFVQALGGSPVGLKINETYEGLQKGTINTSFVSSTQTEAYLIYEVAPYVKRINFTYTPLIPAMNQTFYNNLSDDLKVLFDEELMPALADIAIEAYVKVAEETYVRTQEHVKEKGEFSVATEEEKNVLKAASQSAWDAWAKDADDRGYDGAALVQTYLELLDEKNIPRPY